MAKIILASGGARSGKSSYTKQAAEALPGKRAFVATCPASVEGDTEMQERILRHQQDRLGAGWETIEEEIDLQGVLTRYPLFDVLLIDCLTLWISNLMRRFGDITEDEITSMSRELVLQAKERRGTVIFVTNEVGCGVVPVNAMARKFRDLTGRCNQAVASGADEVIYFTCGVPIFVKKPGPATE